MTSLRVMNSILAIEGYPELEPAKATIIDNDFGCGDNLIKMVTSRISNQKKIDNGGTKTFQADT